VFIASLLSKKPQVWNGRALNSLESLKELTSILTEYCGGVDELKVRSEAVTLFGYGNIFLNNRQHDTTCLPNGTKYLELIFTHLALPHWPLRLEQLNTMEKAADYWKHVYTFSLIENSDETDGCMGES
jgi:hypothetical protein